MTLTLTLSLSGAGEDMPMLVGNLVAILASGLVCIIVSLIKPDNYDWKSTREITMVDDAETGGAALSCACPALLRVPMPQLAAAAAGAECQVLAAVIL